MKPNYQNTTIAFCSSLLILLMLSCSPGKRGLGKQSVPELSSAEQMHQIFKEQARYDKEAVWWSDVRPEKQAERLVYYQRMMERLAKINRMDLSGQDVISLDIFKFILQDKIKRIEFSDYLMPFNAEGGFFTSLTFLQRTFRFDAYKDYRKYLEMLEGYEQHMERNMANMRIGMEKGITQPRWIAERYESLIAPFLNTTLENSFFYEPFTRMPENISEPSQEELKERARKVIGDEILIVYSEFDRFMKEEYIPACREELGATALPEGKAYYEHLVNYFTTLPISPDEIYALGEQEVARIEADMQAVMTETGFEGSFSAFLTFLRTDPQFYPKTPEELLRHAAYISKQIDGLLPNYFYRLPRLPYGVQAVPADIAPNYTSGRYSPGSVDAHRAGHYWVNTYKLESRPLYVLPALTLHEAVPGHHLQMSLAQEMEAVPDFRRSLYLSSYGEGWALYCEWLGLEMGIYKTPYERFGRLSYEMWRACRLVVDVGLHAKGWTRQQAVDYMAARTSLSLHEINTEVDRYIGWPGQALSYKMGELKIRELRQKTAQALGGRFDLRDFHDLLLENGAVPLFVLEEMVEEYIVGNRGEE